MLGLNKHLQPKMKPRNFNKGQKLVAGKMHLKLKQKKTLWKIEVTKKHHHMEKLCILPKDVHVMASERDVEQLWSLLESTPETMDELCVAGKKNTEVENQKVVVKEA